MMKYRSNKAYLIKFLEKTILLCALSSTLASCASKYVGLDTRIFRAQEVAKKHGMTRHVIKGGKFFLLTYQRITNPYSPYTIYIEGDGFAFKNVYTISDDPTPTKPMLLNLAGLDNRPNIVYIARPCQYVKDSNLPICNNNSYWSDRRMSEDVVASINDVIEDVARNKVPVNLIGFSGGGGVAALVAARNPRVISIVTIAGNLDHVAFNQYHRTRPMIGSLNPIDYASKISGIPQLHFSGGKDKIVPPIIGDKFVKASNSQCVRQEIIPEAEHQNGWEKIWNYILSTKPRC